MKHNTIIDKLKQSVEAITFAPGDHRHLRFYYNDGYSLNVDFDTAEYPCVAAVLVESGAVTQDGGQYAERITLNVDFLDRAQLPCAEQDGLTNEQIIDCCKQRAFRWLSSLQPVKDLQLISVNQTFRLYSEDDAVLTGYQVNVTLQEVQTYGRCQL